MKKNIIYFFISIILGILLGLGLIYVLKTNKNYYAVFLNNGSIYFGKLKTFPSLKLINPYFLQVDQSNQISIQRFQDFFWQPKNVIYLNKNSIVFVAPLSESSPFNDLIEKGFINNSSLKPSQLNDLSTSSNFKK